MRTQILHIIVALVLVLQLSCANIQITTNRNDATRTPLACALYAANLHDDPSEISEVAVKYAEAGDFKKAIEVAEAISEKHFIELVNQAFFFRRVKEYSVSEKIKAFSEIAIWQAKSGKTNEARITLEKAFSLSDLLKGPHDISRESQLEKIVPKFVLIGDEERAISIAESLPTEKPLESETYFTSSKISMLVLVAENLAQIGHKEKSVEMLGQAENLFNQFPLVDISGTEAMKMVEIYVQLGKQDKAFEILSMLTEREEASAQKKPGLKPNGLKEIAIMLVKLGKLPEGVNLALSIKDPQTQAWAIADIASLLAKSKDYVAALTLLNKVPEGEIRFKFRAQAEIAKLLLDDGNFDKALELTNQIESKNEKASVLAYVAQKYSKLGNQDKARETAIAAFEFCKDIKNDNGFIESALQYVLLVDKNVVLEMMKEEGLKADDFNWLLPTMSEKLAEANQDKLATEILNYIQTEGQIIHGGTITVRDYRAQAIVKIAIQYYDSKHPVDANLQATLAEFVKLLD